MPRVKPQPLLAAEVHHGKLPNRSIRYATDLAPRLDQVDVVFTGHAHVPSGSLPRLTVRLAIFDERRPVLDKHLVVQDAAGFSKMPIVYERAKGGLGQAENPFGREDPNIIDPAHPSAPAGFGPMSRTWPVRRKLLGNTPRKALEQPIAEIPDGFDFTYFQSAPADQRCDSLLGDEWILLEGLHASLAVIRTRLPGGVGVARIDGLGPFGIPEGTRLPLRLDTVQIDGDEQWCSLVFREAFEVPNEEAVAAARIVAGIDVDGDAAGSLDASAEEPAPRVARTPALPSVATTIELSEEDLNTWDSSDDDDVTVTRDASEPAPRPVAADRFDGTVALDPEAASGGRALPFEGTATPAAPAPKPPASIPPAPPARAAFPPAAAGIGPISPPSIQFFPPTPAAPARTQDLGRTVTGIESEPAGEALPFDPNAEPSLPSEQRQAPDGAGSNTYVLEAEEQESAAEKVVVPFISRAPTQPMGHERRANEVYVPPRTAEAIPIFTKTAFTACTIPWQLLPGQEVRTVIVKATFDLVPDGPAKQRQDPEPPSGDLFEGGDPQRDLRYPSDFAIFKPRADVTLRGHAHAPGGRSSAAEVVFRFGRDRKRFERRLAVFGDRFWQKGLVPTHPEAFEAMPLVHERAYGGPDFVKNPLGRGRAPGPDGRTPLPNLEDRDNLIKSPTASPMPACCAPLPAFFRDRSSKLGTYGPAWTKTRWPYFPEDFDWAHFQHAPAAQQIDFPTGDEPFDLRGVRPDEPRVSGKLAGAVPRAFAQRTTAAGGHFFEVVLRLDTVAFDADVMKVDLVWRGLLDVVDDEASDIAELYVLAGTTSGAAVDPERARARYRAERGPWPIVASEPGHGAPANAPQAGQASAHEARIGAKLRAAGVTAAGGGVTAAGGGAAAAGGGAAAASPPPAGDVRPAAPRDDEALRSEVRDRLAKGVTLDGLELDGADLSGLDFSSQSLSFLNLKDAVLRGCRLAATDLSGAVLAGADLSDATLERAVLAGADLTGAILERADLTEADLAVADLSGARAAGATFSRAHGAHPRFTGADLTRARFDGADIRAADLTRATLDGATFDDVKAAEIRLYEARGAKASFKRADLTEARADGARLTSCSLALVKAAASVWDGAVLDGSTFLGAALAGSGFARASCERTVLSGADLTDARMPRAKLSGAQLVRANLMRASLEAADLTGADMRGANLHGAETWKAKLRGAKLDLAIVTQTKLAKEKA